MLLIPALFIAISAVLIARFNSDVYKTSGINPASFNKTPALAASASPFCDNSTSTQPVKRFLAFQALSPWRSKINFRLILVILSQL